MNILQCNAWGDRMERRNLVWRDGIFFFCWRVTGTLRDRATRELSMNRMRLFLFGLIGLIVMCQGAAWADYLDTWHWRNPLPQGHTLLSVAYGNNTFVAVSDNGTILTSSDGIAWSKRTSHTARALNSVTYGGGIFVAVGNYNTVVTSPDGITWTTRDPGIPPHPPVPPQTVGDPRTVTLTGVSYGNGTFVAVGTYEIIITSTDGATWSTRNLVESGYQLKSVA